jgi:hypothetical protein
MPNLPNLAEAQAEQDAGKRLHDAIALHLVADFDRAIRSVVIVRLEDGSTDGVMYDSWEDACRLLERYRDARWWAPVRITPDGITVRDATLLLRTLRNFPGIKAVPEPRLQSAIHPPGGRRLRP